MTPGTAMRLQFGEEVVRGQVWADGADDCTVWVALEDGRYAKVWTLGGKAQIVGADGVAVQGGEGRIAA